MKLTTPQVTTARLHRRSGKGNCYKKIYSGHQKSFNGNKREIVRETSPCDNSDDSGLGIENSPEYLYNSALPHPSVFRFASSQKRPAEVPYAVSSKRQRLDLKVENYLNDSYTFPIQPSTLLTSNSISPTSSLQTPIPPVASKAMRRSLVAGKRFPGPVTLSSQLSSTTRNGKIQLQILNQPEQQHRARYQTEGSRGAVKDRTGNSFPVVKIAGYDKLTTLQVFIGSDQGRVTPHMFYQACRVTGKNSTPCTERNIDGTIVIEIDMEPAKDMTVTCDCVGILKERNVDVEHRFPEECSTRSKKKSTRCRMVFRTTITNDDGTTETLQVASQPIACTQPPGVPEICKKSLTSCPVSGGKELFILGKNFLKDTQIVFQTDDWEQSVNPDKEFLQQTHLVCVVPTYKTIETTEPITAKISVVSGSRASEPHSFVYVPLSSASALPAASNSSSMVTDTVSKCSDTDAAKSSDTASGLNQVNETGIKTSPSSLDECDSGHPVLLWPSANDNCGLQNDSKMMPPPNMLHRRPSTHMMVSENMQNDLTSSTSDVIPPTTNSQLTTYTSSTPFTSLPEVPQLMPDFARDFRSISNVDATIKTEPTVPKLESLGDSNMSCTAESFADSDTQSGQQCLVPSTNASTPLCMSQSGNLYRPNDNYMFSAAATNMYADAVTKSEQLENHSPIQELTGFDVATTATPIMPSNASTDLMLATATMKQADSVNFLNNTGSLQMASTNMLPNIRSQIEQKIPQMIDMPEPTFGKQRSFGMQQQQQQQLTNCLMKQSASYENLRSNLCYKNVPSSTETAVVDMYPNYMNLETNTNENKSAANTLPVPITTAESSLLLESTSLSLISDVMRPKNTLDNYTSALSSNKSQSMVNNATNFLNSQPQESSLSNFVPSSLENDAANTVPKLEELVSSTAESFMRSANQPTSSGRLNTSSNGVSNQMSLDNFLNSGTSSANLMNNVMCGGGGGVGVMPNTENCVPNNTMAPVVFQCNTIMATTTSNDMKEKQMGMPEMKKTVEGMFSSEISRMTDNDLLSYINPSCFDEEKFAATLGNV